MACARWAAGLCLLGAALLAAAVAGRAATLAANERSHFGYTTGVGGPIGDEDTFRGSAPKLGRPAENGSHVFLVEATASRVFSRPIRRTADGNIVTGAAQTIVPEVGQECDTSDPNFIYCYSWKTGFGGDGGPASKAKMANPQGLALDGRLLYIADTGNCRIRRVNLDTRIITTVVGNGDCTPRAFNAGVDNAELPGTQVPLSYPQDLAVDGLGSLYIADTGNRRIRKLDIASGKVTTLVGPGPASPAANFTGDYGPGKSALLLKPVAIAVYVLKDRCFPWGCDVQYPVLFIADQDAHVVRRYNVSSGIIIPVAGKWGVQAQADALPYFSPVTARGALLYGPRGITVDPRDGSSVWIADYAHVHVLSGTQLKTVTTNKRFPLPTSGFGVQLSTLNVERFKHVFLASDEAYSGPGAFSLWLVTAEITGGASGYYYYSDSLVVSTQNLDDVVLGRKPPPALIMGEGDL